MGVIHAPHEELGTEIPGNGVMHKPHELKAPIEDKTKIIVPMSGRKEYHASMSSGGSKDGGGKGVDIQGMEEVKQTVIDGRMRDCSHHMARIHCRPPNHTLSIHVLLQWGGEVRQLTSGYLSLLSLRDEQKTALLGDAIRRMPRESRHPQGRIHA